MPRARARGARPGFRRGGVGGVLRRLEDAGFAVETVEPGTVLFETRGVERLYGGVQPALERALAAVGTAWDPRAGAGQRRFAALAAASVARPGQIVIVEGERERDFLAPLPLSLLPLPPELCRARRARRAPARRPRPPAGRSRRGAAGAGGAAGVAARARRGAPPRARAGAPRGACRGALLPRGGRQRADAPARARRAARSADRPAGACGTAVPQGRRLRPARRRRVLAAHGNAPGGDGGALGFASRSGPSWRSCRRPCSSCGSRRFSWPSTRAASSRSCRPRARLGERLREGLRQVKASTGTGSVCAVVEVAPWSRIPESRALVVPRDV